MGSNLYQKIIGRHLVAGTMVAGKEVAISIDQTLTQDALGTMVYLELESLKVSQVKTDSYSYIDHNTLQEGFENADDHRYLQTVADKYGIKYSKAGNGICHQVHLERFSRPGQTLIGSDSHTPTCGAVGMLAIGVGGIDVALAMAGNPFNFIYPKVIRVVLTGKLPLWSSAKDIILHMLRLLTTKGNVGTVIEYGGPGVLTLSVPERSTITNMGTEMGVTTSIFPSDEVTRAFFKAQKREDEWVPLAADADAVYDRIIEINLGTIVPLVACPHSPDNVKPVSEVAGLKVDQVLVGSCTNSSYRDLKIVAGILKGKRVHDDVSFGVSPGSRQVLLMISADGTLHDLVKAGARILESACGFCVGSGQAPRSGGVSIRTNNRNFEGRSGTRDASVYLVSPETAAVTALYGELRDPATSGLSYPQFEVPSSFEIDDSQVLYPSCNPATEVYRGPNIGLPPSNTPMPDTIRCRVAIKVGDKITTDHIMPAGALMKYRSNIPKYSRYVFRDLHSDFAGQCDSIRSEGLEAAIVAGLSYGQGSSREHAAICPMYLGVRILLARSVERIHAANLVNFGILYLTFQDVMDYTRLKDGDIIVIENARKAINNEVVTIENRTQGYQFNVCCDLTDRQKSIVLAGGVLNIHAKE